MYGHEGIYFPKLCANRVSFQEDTVLPEICSNRVNFQVDSVGPIVADVWSLGTCIFLMFLLTELSLKKLSTANRG